MPLMTLQESGLSELLLIFHHHVHTPFTLSPAKQKETLGFLQAATQGALLGRQGYGWYNEWLSVPGPRPWIRRQV